MNWQYIDQRLRDGSILYWHFTFGPWLEHPDGQRENCNLNAAKALMRRDRVVFLGKLEDFVYHWKGKPFSSTKDS